MQPSFVQWLDHLGTEALFAAVSAFVLVNGAFVAGIIVRRDHGFVNRWTSRVLAIDLALAGLGLGVPAVSATARAVVRTLVPAIRDGFDTTVIQGPRPITPGAEAAPPLRP